MVSNYLAKTDGGCRYNYQKLKDRVYLISDEHLKNIHIDNGEAYIDGLTETPLMLDGFNIQFKEESSLDERYKFQKTLNISVHGVPDIILYRWENIDINYDYICEYGDKYYKQLLEQGSVDIFKNYYLIIETMDGAFYIVNVDFPAKMTYTYNLSKDRNQTDFTFSSLSNFPVLELKNFEKPSFDGLDCKDYMVNDVDGLQLLEKPFSSISNYEKKVYFTEPLKTVEYLGDSLAFQESFDGEKITSTLEFQIAFDAYKSSWQYNLLEFVQNTYIAKIGIKNDFKSIYSGFNYGLQPNYTINATTEQSQSDIITISLTETSQIGSLFGEFEIIENQDKHWRYISSLNGIQSYECVGNGLAKYLLQEECDKFGTPTGNYKVLEGYQNMFPTLNIIGTFSNVETFKSPDCYSSDAIYKWETADINEEWICDDCGGQVITKWVTIPITERYICDECGEAPAIYKWETADITKEWICDDC